MPVLESPLFTALPVIGPCLPRFLIGASQEDLAPPALGKHAVGLSNIARLPRPVAGAANWQADAVTVGMRVVNEGSRPVTISAAGWELRMQPDMVGATMTVGASEPLVPALPHRLDANDDVTWRWDPWLTEHLVDVDAFRPFVDVYGLRQPRRLRRLVGNDAPEELRRRYTRGKQWIEPILLIAMRQAMDAARQESDPFPDNPSDA